MERIYLDATRIRGYNSVNYKNGYKILEIRTPREYWKYENKSPKKEKSVMDKLRDIRDKIGRDIQDMSYEELKAYLEAHSKLHSRKILELKK